MITAMALGMFAVQPVAAQEQTDLTEDIALLRNAVTDAYRLGYDRKDEINTVLLEVASRAEAMLAEVSEEMDAERKLDLLSVIGQAYFGAAQHHDSEWGSAEDLIDRDWLIKAADALGLVVAARPEDSHAPAYEYRGASGQLWQHARYYDLPQKVEWSARRIQANRYMLARLPGDALERQFLAESLYEHGWLTKDAALIAEADAIFDSFPSDEKPYELERCREAIAQGHAPYADAGEVFW